MIYPHCYDALLENCTEEEAIEYARGMVFGECETSEQNIAHANMVSITDGIGIHYCYGADHYFFTDETPETSDA